MATTEIPTVLLNSGNPIPQLGFGVFKVDEAETERVVTDAIEAGYRHFDGAKIYGNEAALGRAIAASGIPREQFFITTKLWGDDQGTDSTGPALEASLERLGLDWVDLYLIHWPHPGLDRYVEAWNAMEDLAERGLTRSIGVSNFTEEHLERVVEASSTVPAVNQIELHPRLPQIETRAYNRAHGILTEAWSPLARGTLLDEPTLVALADKHGRTVAQIVLRWQLDLGNVVIPKSVHRERLASNLEVFDFALDADDLAVIAALESGERTGKDPDLFF
jgi:2,5-diketo-D-gluconate reductase A